MASVGYFTLKQANKTLKPSGKSNICCFQVFPSVLDIIYTTCLSQEQVQHFMLQADVD